MTAAGAGALAVPVLVCGILVYGYVKGVPVFQSFLTGAREGLSTGVRLLPPPSRPPAVRVVRAKPSTPSARRTSLRALV